jgi:cytochrome oxidase Cu insertion factor (SCO1/SenC/PrrC family)
MPGMNTGLNLNDPAVIAAFKTALLHQGVIALLIFASFWLAWVSARAWLAVPAETAADQGVAGDPGTAAGEPAWRRVLRIGFGVLWLLDGILQAQPQMAVGLPSDVIQPAASSSPGWVQHVVNWAGTSWSYHPMQAGAAAVWIQVGIGIWMLAAPSGTFSRLAGLAGAAWGLIVWVFGEAFGGILAPGLTWLFGAPGAAALYVVAGVLVALPERRWRSALLGRVTVAGFGAFLIGMAVLQAWPGRGFWQGTLRGKPGSLAAMTSDMAGTPQPRVLSSMVAAFTAFDQAHGFAVNLAAVIALAVIGAAFVTTRPALARPALIAFAVLCLADWVLIEDIGIFGGLGTDPNSIIPLLLLAVAGYLALCQEPARAPAPAAAAAVAAAGWRDRLRPAAWPRSVASAGIRSVAAAGAVGVVILGAAPLAAAQANPVADTILAQAIAGSSAATNHRAATFSLTDQRGGTVTLASLRGKVVLLTFLDPVCTSDCPLEAQEFRLASQMLGGDARRVELVAIVANPVDYQIGYVQAFDRQERLTGLPNWLFLTGSPSQLRQVWQNYGIAADIEPAGSMIGHSEVAFVIGENGHVRRELNFDPGPGTAATTSSFAAELADAARQLLARP